MYPIVSIYIFYRGTSNDNLAIITISSIITITYLPTFVNGIFSVFESRSFNHYTNWVSTQNVNAQVISPG